MEVEFSNKVVLVTGASAGIGSATALAFASLGAGLALVGRCESRLRKVELRCQQHGSRQTLCVVADLATDEGVEKTVQETIKYFGKLDVLVNNAGISARTCIQQTDMKIFDEVFKIDVRAVYNLTRLFVPHLIQTNGNIVNVSSILGSMVAVGSLPYSMAKAALDHFSQLIALELAPKGVRVNTVSPGITVSTSLKRMTGCSEEEYQSWLNKSTAKIPLGEVCTGLDVASMIVHLASDQSRLVTGVNVQVDGGLRFIGKSCFVTDQIK